MSKQKLSIDVEAASEEEAKKIIASCYKIYQASRGILSLEEFSCFANNLKNDPGSIRTLKTFKPKLFK